MVGITVIERSASHDVDEMSPNDDELSEDGALSDCCSLSSLSDDLSSLSDTPVELPPPSSSSELLELPQSFDTKPYQRGIDEVLRTANDLLKLVVIAVKEAVGYYYRTRQREGGPPEGGPESGPSPGQPQSQTQSQTQSQSQSQPPPPPPPPHGRLVVVMAAADPDAMAAVSLMKHSFCNRLGLKMHLIVISTASQLNQTFSSEAERPRSPLREAACIFLINVGARHFICPQVAKLWQEDATTTWRPHIFIIDHRRPYHASYFDSLDTPPCPTFLIGTSAEVRAIQLLDEKVRKLAQEEENDEEQELLLQATGFTETDLLALDDIVQVGASVGEFSGECASMVLMETIKQLNCESPGAYLLAAVGLAAHWNMDYISFINYERKVNELIASYNQLKDLWATQKHHLLEFVFIGRSKAEVLLPLLRFSELKSGVQNSTAFVARRLSWTGTEDLLEKELAYARVALGLQDTAWQNHFRLLLPTDQKRLLQRNLPKYFKKLASTLKPGIALSAKDSVLGPTFFRRLAVVGLPDRITANDIAFLLLLTLGRPSRSNIEEYEATIESAVDCLRLLDFISSARGFTKRRTYHQQSCRIRTSYGDAWDLFIPFEGSGTHVSLSAYRSLESMTKVGVSIQGLIAVLIGSLAGKRQRGNADVYRRSTDGYECIVDMEVPRCLLSPDLLRYIAVQATEAFTRGDPSIVPGVLLVAGSPGGPNAILLAYKPHATALSTNRMGLALAKALEKLAAIGVLREFKEDYFESTVARIAKQQASWIVDTLFPRKEKKESHRTETSTKTITTAKRTDHDSRPKSAPSALQVDETPPSDKENDCVISKPRRRKFRVLEGTSSDDRSNDRAHHQRVKRSHQRVYYNMSSESPPSDNEPPVRISANGWPEMNQSQSRREEYFPQATNQNDNIVIEELNPGSWNEDFFQTSLSKKRRKD